LSYRPVSFNFLRLFNFYGKNTICVKRKLLLFFQPELFFIVFKCRRGGGSKYQGEVVKMFTFAQYTVGLIINIIKTLYSILHHIQKKWGRGWKTQSTNTKYEVKLQWNNLHVSNVEFIIKMYINTQEIKFLNNAWGKNSVPKTVLKDKLRTVSSFLYRLEPAHTWEGI